MITFAIPTWNRADKLRICLDSMIEQIKEVDDKVLICIYNNVSTDNTEEVLKEFKEKYPDIVNYKSGEEHLPFAGSFKNAFMMPETEYTWMFGDDDILSPNGLIIVLDVLKRKNIDFVHGAEASRVANEQRSFYATTKNLCYGFGFIDVTGFISGNIVKTKPYQNVLNSKDMNLYNKSSFPQSLSILDAFADSPAALINAPIVDNQNRSQTEESCARWQAENIQLNYAMVSSGIEKLISKGKVDKELPNDFFRYLTGNMFGKTMYNFYAHMQTTNDYVGEEYWKEVVKMASFLKLEDKEKMLVIIKEFKKSFNAYVAHVKKSDKLLQQLQIDHDKSTDTIYPFSYT